VQGAVSGNYILESSRSDRYDAFELSLRHNFRQRYAVFGAYTYSRTRTNHVFDFSLDIPLLSPQRPGPYPWDTPHRFVGWGVVPFFKLPVIRQVDLAYSAEARSGLPFNATTDQGQIPSAYPPGTLRLPTYYSVNLHLEKRFHLFGYYWALRGGFNNVSNHANASLANGIIDASHPFPTYVDSSGRAFTGRIRYLGRK
jgi:hypothetical protein